MPGKLRKSTPAAYVHLAKGVKVIPNYDAPVQEWLEQGLAVVSSKGQKAELRDMSFLEAEAKALVYLTGRGAQAIDREAKEKVPRP